MSKELIIQHLVTRYICGYKVTDPIYKKIKNYLMSKLEYNNKLSIELTKHLVEYLGPYNTTTAGLYIDLAASVHRKLNHKRPSTDDIFNLI